MSNASLKGSGGVAIGSPVVGGTESLVLFVGAGGVLAQDLAFTFNTILKTVRARSVEAIASGMGATIVEEGLYDTGVTGLYAIDGVGLTALIAGFNLGTLTWSFGPHLTQTGTSVISAVDITIPDEAYGAGWNGSLEAPTKNAVYDKIESLSPGGGGNFEQATVDFGSSASQNFNAVTTVPAAWVTSSSIILCTPSGEATADHDPEDYILEGITACVTNIVDGVSFDVLAGCPTGTFGDFIINCTGA